MRCFLVAHDTWAITEFLFLSYVDPKTGLCLKVSDYSALVKDMDKLE